jgi:DNA-binding NtrC family response regulator
VNILVVDDDKVTVDLLKEVLEQNKLEVTTASSAEAALKHLKGNTVPIILSDIKMVKMDGLGLLKEIKSTYPNSVVVLMTAFGSVDTAVDAVKGGAFDYISKPFQIAPLMDVIKKAEAHAKYLSSSKNVTKKHSNEFIHVEKTLVGRSQAIVDVFKSIGKAAVTDSTVLIVGESGTGKELVAREIHERSSRKGKPFVAVNCGALTETLLESELFGHLRGAFTGAVTDKKGLFEEAHAGTIFLDEIGEVQKPLQVKLLRVLQESEVKPVGSSTVRRIDVRVIAATNQILDNLVANGSFRKDLFFRLKVLTIGLPPLTERMEDLSELVSYFIERCSLKQKKEVSHVSDEAMRLLSLYEWPGNIRELEHAVEHAVVMTKTSVLFPDDFPKEIQNSNNLPSKKFDITNSARTLEGLEKEHILGTLEKAKFNKTKAAQMLGIDRATLYRKLQRFGLADAEIKKN